MIFYKNTSNEQFILRGIQRSGTNFFEKLSDKLQLKMINNNDYKRNDVRHKHFRVQDEKSSIVMDKQYTNNVYIKTIEELNLLSFKKKKLKNIVILKDPINWIMSINKWAIRCKWIPRDKNLFEDKELMFKYLIEWDNFYLKWHQLSQDSNLILIIQWENIIQDFQNTLKDIKNFFKIERQYEVFDLKTIKNVNLSENSNIDVRVNVNNNQLLEIYKSIKFKKFNKIY